MFEIDLNFFNGPEICPRSGFLAFTENERVRFF